MLHQTTFPSDLLRVDGALDLEPTARGVRPRRLPAWTRPQLPDALFDLVAQSTAGVRIALRTDATVIELTLHVTQVELPSGRTLPAVLDLVVNGEVTHRQTAAGGDVLRIMWGSSDVDIVPGTTETIRFTGLLRGDKDVEIWLPQAAACDLVSLAADAPIHPATTSIAPRWVHYGSSISHCVEADGPTGTWPAVAAAKANLRLTDLGFSGNAMLDPFVARTIRDLPADLISLKIGANIVADATMRQRTFLPAVHGFLDTIRDGHPSTPIVVISPISCPPLENRPGPIMSAHPRPQEATETDTGALTMSAVRELLHGIVQDRTATDAALSYVDGRALLGPDETGDLHDGIHPNAAAYRRMGGRFVSLLGLVDLQPGQARSTTS
ncbi:GDSL-type esterase/lipase family protein [Dactylosporangium darangshiense]